MPRSSVSAAANITVNTVVITAIGTVNETTGLGAVRLVIDANRNGVVDGGEELIHVYAGLESELSMDSAEDESTFRYRPIGALSVSPQTRTIELCDDRTLETGRQIVISTTGRPQISSFACT